MKYNLVWRVFHNDGFWVHHDGGGGDRLTDKERNSKAPGSPKAFPSWTGGCLMTGSQYTMMAERQTDRDRETGRDTERERQSDRQVERQTYKNRLTWKPQSFPFMDWRVLMTGSQYTMMAVALKSVPCTLRGVAIGTAVQRNVSTARL